MGIRNGNLYRVIPTNLHSVIPTKVGMTGFEIAAFIGKNRNRSAVIPAQAGIQPCRYGNLSGKRFLEILRSRFPLSWE
ncbi:hypothetical protein A6J51_13310 [Neisseria meningitidis]|nr:hypothetical protein A6J51_13310 [Neisseria meningitidis]